MTTIPPLIINLTAATTVDFHLEWGDNVMRNADKTIKDPMDKAESVYVFIFNIFNCLLALPLNVYVVLVILLTKRLRNQTQYSVQLNTMGVCDIKEITDRENLMETNHISCIFPLYKPRA